jgi:2'-5' RNA ligase
MRETKKRLKTSQSVEFCFLLIPEKRLQQRLKTIIKKLAADWDARAFDPHVTVYCGPSNEGEASRIARQAAASFTSFELVPSGLKHSRLLAKTLFVQFAESSELCRMFSVIRAASSKASAYRLNPHLSLLYKKVPPADRAALCRTLAVPGGVYRFDALRVVAINVPFTDPDQIGQWQTVCEEKFRN